ncbi:hypothetical protein ACLQ3C_05555 [Gordonia sp. DT30]|uniref:hypothetical protein n=1 Tax=Gordonia sp. DT30 TaxID=3416546 RepID=UPI003CE7E70B
MVPVPAAPAPPAASPGPAGTGSNPDAASPGPATSGPGSGPAAPRPAVPAPGTAEPAPQPRLTLAAVGGFLGDISPGLLLLLGAVALVGTGPFLDALRSTRL